MDLGHLLRLGLLIAAAVAYYAWGISAVGRITRSAGRRRLARAAWASRYTADEAESIVGLLAAAVGQTTFFVVALLLTGLSFDAVAGGGIEPRLLGLGAVLGVGEAALASFVGYLALPATKGRADDVGGAQQWLATGRGGWMRLYLRTAEVAPWPLLVVLTTVYVTVEEAVFRGLLVSMLSSYGLGLAVVGSAALFVAVQMLHMPSWRAGLFPAAGGLVVGIIHGVLFVTIGDLAPLIVAHLTMFLVLVW